MGMDVVRLSKAFSKAVEPAPRKKAGF